MQVVQVTERSCKQKTDERAGGWACKYWAIKDGMKRDLAVDRGGVLGTVYPELPKLKSALLDETHASGKTSP